MLFSHTNKRVQNCYIRIFWLKILYEMVARFCFKFQSFRYWRRRYLEFWWWYKNVLYTVLWNTLWIIIITSKWWNTFEMNKNKTHTHVHVHALRGVKDRLHKCAQTNISSLSFQIFIIIIRAVNTFFARRICVCMGAPDT